MADHAHSSSHGHDHHQGEHGHGEDRKLIDEEHAEIEHEEQDDPCRRDVARRHQIGPQQGEPGGARCLG